MGEGRGEGAGEDVCLLPRKARKLLPLAIKIKDFVSEIAFHGFIAARSPPP